MSEYQTLALKLIYFLNFLTTIFFPKIKGEKKTLIPDNGIGPFSFFLFYQLVRN